MKAFVTGSRAYGTPREDSDIDLVVMISRTDIDRLMAMSDENDEGDNVEYEGSTAVLRFGALNLLCCEKEDDFRVWREGTDALMARRPVTRDEAVAELSARRDALEAERAAAAERSAQESKPAPGAALTLPSGRSDFPEDW